MSFAATETPLHLISLGAGVQSTTLALMAACGEIEPMPDGAIFADTQAEPADVYRHLDWLMSGVLPFPVHVVTAGSLALQILKSAAGEGHNNGRPPFFVRNADGSGGILRRQCTGDFKLDPLHRKTRELLGLYPGQQVTSFLGIRRDAPMPVLVESWIGISTDEAGRMKPSRHDWIEHRFPLIEKMMSRHDCLKWLDAHGYPRPSKSACVFCPYHSDAEWRRIRDTDRGGWSVAVQIDEALRTVGYRSSVGEGYLHRSMVPLAEVDLRLADEKSGQGNLFMQECEGMCGV